MISFTVFGKPVGKQRARTGRYGRFYTPTKTLIYENSVAWYYRDAAKGFRFPDKRKICMELTIYFKDNVRPDADNVEKAIKDGLQGVAYKNDKYVIVKSKDYDFDKDEPRVEVKLYMEDKQ